MTPELAQTVAEGLGLAAIPPLSVATAFPALMVGRRARPRSRRELAIRCVAAAALLTIFIGIYPEALHHPALVRMARAG